MFEVLFIFLIIFFIVFWGIWCDLEFFIEEWGFFIILFINLFFLLFWKGFEAILSIGVFRFFGLCVFSFLDLIEICFFISFLNLLERLSEDLGLRFIFFWFLACFFWFVFFFVRFFFVFFILFLNWFKFWLIGNLFFSMFKIKL